MTRTYENNRPTLHCTFCLKSHDDVKRIIASSPSIAICDECVKQCSTILKNGSDLKNVGQYQVLQGGAATSDKGFWLWRRIRDSLSEHIRCSFCHKRQIDVDRMIGKDQHYVCDECVTAILNLLEQEEDH